jgi:hypothetical protein
MSVNEIMINGCNWLTWEVSDEDMPGLIEWLNDNAKKVPDANDVNALFVHEEDSNSDEDMIELLVADDDGEEIYTISTIIPPSDEKNDIHPLL